MSSWRGRHGAMQRSCKNCAAQGGDVAAAGVLPGAAAAAAAGDTFPAAWLELWSSGELLDVTLLSSDGVPFRAHRVVLCAVSPFFRLLFTNAIDGKKGSEREKQVDLPARLLQVVVEYAYTGRCRVAADNVQDLLPAADKYGIAGIVQQCCLFLLRELTPANCLGILRFARYYFCRDIERAGDRFVKLNFQRIVQESPELVEMSADELERLLCDDELNVGDEATVFTAIVRWVDAEPTTRRCHLPELLHCVRYGFLSYRYFIDTVLRCKYVQESTDLQLLLEEPSILLTEMVTRPFWEVDLNHHLARPRIPCEVMFAVGGWSSGSPTNFVETYDPRSQRWLLSQHTDTLPRSYHGTCVLGGLVYVVGGFDGQKHFNSVRCFDPVSMEWRERACMYNARCYVSVCVLDGLMYALGGYNGRARLSSAERYYPQYNQWQMIPPMNRPRSDASAAALRGKVYIAGGFNGSEIMSSAEVFDPTSMQWTLISPMNSPRSGISIVAFEDRLYAIGGIDGANRLNSVECIVPTQQYAAWREVAPMITPRSNFGCAILNDMIYVIGGYNGTTTIPHVESYDPKDNVWSSEQPMNLNRSALTACVLVGLPNAREYSYLSKVWQVGQGCCSKDNG